MRSLSALAVMTCVAIAAACDGTEPSNTPPVAAFTARCDKLACVFQNASRDADGSIVGYAWSFGDGGTSTDRSPTHNYPSSGADFMVTLVVTDDGGAKGERSTRLAVSADSVHAAGDNLPPVAAFTVTCTNLTCRFTDQSADPDVGDSLVSHAWSFGDGLNSAAPSPEHTYASPGGQFTVRLTVSDRHDATASVTQPVLARSAAPDIAGTYERETPHTSAIRGSRYLIRTDGSFDYIEDNNTGQRILHGHWTPARGGQRIIPDADIDLDFEGFFSNQVAGGIDAFGSFLMDGHLGVSYTQVMIQAGLEEGVYTDVPDDGITNAAPPQAGQIAFSREGKIYLANTDGSGLVQLTAGPYDGEPAWSPDGSRIAFSRGGSTGGIYVMGADGSNPVRRADSGGSPSWSPDGRTVAFSCRVNLDQGICAAGADEGGTGLETLLVRQGQVTHPAWSPDGTSIAFSSDWRAYDFLFDIWVMSLDGSQSTLLRNSASSAPDVSEQYQPAWSPDGQRIAFVACRWAFNFCSSSAITVMDADGTGPVRVAVASGFAHPTWSPDGRIIAFASGGSIEWVAADGGQHGRIIANGTSPAWRPR